MLHFWSNVHNPFIYGEHLQKSICYNEQGRSYRFMSLGGNEFGKRQIKRKTVLL